MHIIRSLAANVRRQNEDREKTHRQVLNLRKVKMAMEDNNKEIKKQQPDNKQDDRQMDYIDKILKSLREIQYIKPEEIPSINLYMDQVTTFMEEHLSNMRRFEDDKLLTRTMINNYTKNNLLPSPDKKKYSMDHMLLLIFIYYLKNVLCISDIQSIVEPLTERYFNNKDTSLKSIYSEIVEMEEGYVDSFAKDIIKKYNNSRKIFLDAKPEEKEFLDNFAFICSLCYDIYFKKTIIEKMLDADILGGNGFDISSGSFTRKEAEARKNQIKKAKSDEQKN